MGTERSRRVVLVGAGHAHLSAFDSIDELVRAGATVTVISPDTFWYSGMGPGVLGGAYQPHEDQVEVESKITDTGARLLATRVTAIDPGGRTLTLSNGQMEPWDILSLNIGSVVPVEQVDGAAEYGIPVKPVKNLARLSRVWMKEPPEQVVVVGGGAAGCEVAANTRARLNAADVGTRVTLVTGAPRLLPNQPERASRIMETWCVENSVQVRTQSEVTQVMEDGVELASGEFLPATDTLMAIGVRPPHLLGKSGLQVAPDGGVVVGPTLQSVSHPRVFGAGDCVSIPRGEGWLDRVGVYAVRAAPVLLRNLVRAVTSDAKPEDWLLQQFRPQKKYVLILNLGDGTGIFIRGGIALHGRLAFRLKDWLDRRFLEKHREG